jgi:hypothetical protein
MNRGRTVRKMYRCSKCRAPKMQCKCAKPSATLGETNMKLAKVKEQRLTDGSLVYDVVNVQASPSDGRVIISALSEQAARLIADAINEHAVAVWGAGA